MDSVDLALDAAFDYALYLATELRKAMEAANPAEAATIARLIADTRRIDAQITSLLRSRQTTMG